MYYGWESSRVVNGSKDKFSVKPSVFLFVSSHFAGASKGSSLLIVTRYIFFLQCGLVEKELVRMGPAFPVFSCSPSFLGAGTKRPASLKLVNLLSNYAVGIFYQLKWNVLEKETL
ncbi:hypothetical protein HS088_TW16G00299 [Tripterygium wilfordii]|uniref:Uncharacterized protein n=1 Tax=Tripterygium wilfordii TaxID=458696 RepID=A0A7J7CIH1_TRIWF|nr:hypothetical protein HS088_TW16G00299 [Tripterygium wilfordii]